MANKLLSNQLEEWLKDENTKNLSGLLQIFGERSLAIVILVLMFFPSLPLPTGGITHVLEVAAMILAVEMILGRKTIWLPKKIQNRDLGKNTIQKVIPFLVKRVRWFEKHSKPWGRSYLDNPYFLRFAGIFLLVLAINAFISPPFSGLDTFPSFSAVLVCMGVILGDMKYFIGGFIVGTVGIISYIFLGSIIFELIKDTYNKIV